MPTVVKSDIESLPDALQNFNTISNTINGRKPALFLDYDGTLAPIVAHPDDALLPSKTKAVIEAVAKLIPVAIISGRDRTDVQEKVGLPQLIYAGSHGFDIAGPDLLQMQYEGGEQALPALDEAVQNLQDQLKDIKGVQIEKKKYAVAVHYRNVAVEEVQKVKEAVTKEVDKQKMLKDGSGKKIMELKPAIDWHKGKAIVWLMEALNLSLDKYIPIFIGDDITDEDALEAVENTGIGIIVGTHGEKTAASYRLADLEEVALFLEKLLEKIGGEQ